MRKYCGDRSPGFLVLNSSLHRVGDGVGDESVSPSGLGIVNNSGRQGDVYGKWVGRTELVIEDRKFMIWEGQAQHKGWFLTVVKIHIKFTINHF